MNRWWLKANGECYWIELTDRKDIGVDLNAPLHDDAGRENWRYNLLKELNENDCVYHYSKPDDAIVSRSMVAEKYIEDDVIWGARGSSARRKGTVPYKRRGLRVALKGHEKLPKPISLNRVRSNANLLRACKSKLEAVYSSPLYTPFELSEKRPARPGQGYLFKLPKGYLEILEEGFDEQTFRGLPEELAEHENHPEGATRRITVNAYERNKSARNDCLKHWGYCCVVCDFDFVSMYGERGKEFIHVHHIRPISEVGETYSVDPINDLRPVCPNCHAMIHKTRPACTVEELSRIINECSHVELS